MYSDAKRKATYKYRSQFDILSVRLKAGTKEEILKYASLNNESMNEYIARAITHALRKDKRKHEKTLSNVTDENLK